MSAPLRFVAALAAVVALVTITAACADGPAGVTAGDTAATPQIATDPTVTAPETVAPEDPTTASDGPPSLSTVTSTALEAHRGLIGRTTPVADAADAVVELANRFLPAGLTITGIEHWIWNGDDGSIIRTDKIAFAELVDENAFLALEAAPPSGWVAAASAVGGDTTTLTFTADDDPATVVFVSRSTNEYSIAPTEFFFQPATDSVVEPAWLASLVVPPGGRLAEIRQTVGYSEFYTASLFARWRYSVDQLPEIIDYLRRELPKATDLEYSEDELRGFTDLIALRSGAWTGDLSIAEGLEGSNDYFDVLYYFALE